MVCHVGRIKKYSARILSREKHQVYLYNKFWFAAQISGCAKTSLDLQKDWGVQCWCRIESPWRAMKTNACPLTGLAHIAPICWWAALILWSVPWNMPSEQQKTTLKEDNHCESYRTFFVSLLFPSNWGLSHEHTQQDGGKLQLFTRSCGHFPHSPRSVSVFWNFRAKFTPFNHLELYCTSGRLLWQQDVGLAQLREADTDLFHRGLEEKRSLFWKFQDKIRSWFKNN